MKKFIIFISTALIALSSYAQLLQSTFTEKSVNGYWQPFLKSTFTYNASNQLINEMVMQYDVQSEKFINASQTNYVYYNSGLLQFKEFVTWDTAKQEWNNSFRLAYTRDAQGSITSLASENWKENIWEPAQRTNYQYDTNNQLLNGTFTEFFDRNTGDYFSATKDVYMYDANGKAIQQTSYSWNTTVQDWKENSRLLTTYNSAGLAIYRERQSFNSGVWTSFWKNNLNYTITNKLSFDQDYYWNSSVNGFSNSTLRTYTYNTDDKLSVLLTQAFEESSSTWIDDRRTTYVYKNTTGLNEANNIVVQAYPSPCQNELRVTLPETGNATIKVMDALGRILLIRETAQQANSIDVSALKSNTYFLLIQQNGKSGVKAFVKQ